MLCPISTIRKSTICGVGRGAPKTTAYLQHTHSALDVVIVAMNDNLPDDVHQGSAQDGEPLQLSAGLHHQAEEKLGDETSEIQGPVEESLRSTAFLAFRLCNSRGSWVKGKCYNNNKLHKDVSYPHRRSQLQASQLSLTKAYLRQYNPGLRLRLQSHHRFPTYRLWSPIIHERITNSSKRTAQHLCPSKVYTTHLTFAFAHLRL